MPSDLEQSDPGTALPVTAHPLVRRTIAAGLIAVIVFFLVLSVAKEWSRIPDLQWRLEPGWIVLGAIGFVVLQSIHGALWAMMLSVLGHPVPAKRALAIWNMSLIARYVPTGLLTFVVRVKLAEREAVPKRVCLLSIAYELALSVAGAVAVGIFALGAVPEVQRHGWRFVLWAVPVLIVLALHPRVFTRLVRPVTRRLGVDSEPVPLPFLTVVAFAVCYALSFVVGGLALFAIAEALHPVGVGDATVLVSAFAVGFTASILAFVVPGGLGAREAGLTLALSPVLPTAVALAVALVARLVLTAVELLLAGATSLIARRADRVRPRELQARPAGVD